MSRTRSEIVTLILLGTMLLSKTDAENEVFSEIIKACVGKVRASEEDFKTLAENMENPNEKQKCINSCVLEELTVLVKKNENGVESCAIDENAAQSLNEVLTEKITDKEYVPIMEKSGELTISCGKKIKNNDCCEYTFLVHKCVRDEMGNDYQKLKEVQELLMQNVE